MVVQIVDLGLDFRTPVLALGVLGQQDVEVHVDVLEVPRAELVEGSLCG